MVWVRLDDGFTRHPRMVAAGLHGRALFIAGLCYCGTHITDGKIPKAAVPMLCAEAGVPGKTWHKLLEVGSWVDHGDEIEVHDWLVYNPSRAKILADREAGAERQRKSRESRGSSRVTGRVSDGVSAPDPSRPVPPPSSQSSSLTVVGTDDDLPEGFWPLFAQRKLAAMPAGTVKSPGPWTKTTAENGALEQGPRARDLWARFDVSPIQLADALISGVVPQGWATQKRVSA